MKRFLLFFSITQSFFVSQLYSHGFDAYTMVRMANHTWEPIEQLARNPQNSEQWVLSHRPHNNYCFVQKVTSGARSKSNCYIHIHFDKNFHNDILCTPTQEFYLPKTDQWLPAYRLRVGACLLSECKNLKAITGIEYIKKPLQIYSIEVEDDHNFLVGYHSILTHNLAIAAPGLWVELSMAFGEGASAGGGIGSYFGPVEVAVGATIGGIGLAGYVLLGFQQCGEYVEPHYGDEYYRSFAAQHHEAPKPKTPKPRIRFTTTGGGGDHEPLDPNRGGHSTAGMPPEDHDSNDATDNKINKKIYDQLEKQLEYDGANSIKKSLNSAKNTLQEHETKLPTLQYKSQVESTIRNVKSQIRTIEEFMKNKRIN